VYDNYLRDNKKKRTTDHHVRKWLTACHRKNVEVYNENRWEIMKYNNASFV